MATSCALKWDKKLVLSPDISHWDAISSRYKSVSTSEDKSNKLNGASST